MKTMFGGRAPAWAALLLAGSATAQQPGATPVTVNNFIRAETDLYFGNAVKEAGGGVGKGHYSREMADVDKQMVIRMNR